MTDTPAPQAIGREVEEWIGKTPDSAVPDRVKLRVFRRYGGRCYLSGLPIQVGQPWDVEHIIPLAIDPTGNRESNLAPALKEPHKAKTAQDRRDIARADRRAKKHHGLGKAKSGGFRAWRRFDGTIVRRDER